MKNYSTFIIAEAGVNHNGNVNKAMKMVDIALDSGADAIKFQSFVTDRLVTKRTRAAHYQIKNTKFFSQMRLLKKLELSSSEQVKLYKYCKLRKIKFLSSAFDTESLDFLFNLGVDIFKIPSGEITNFPYLKKLASLKKKVILSTGASDLKEIIRAISILTRFGTSKKNITILHCNSQYPTPFKDLNLNAIKYMKEKLKVKIGLSDHSIGIEAPIAAVALGAEVVEKHFTINKKYFGPDHKASISPKELKLMIKSIRNIEIAMGERNKKVTRSEKGNITFIRKSIVAKKYIKKGEYLTEKNIDCKRPGNGISPMNWNKVIGKKAKKFFLKDELIKL